MASAARKAAVEALALWDTFADRPHSDARHEALYACVRALRALLSEQPLAPPPAPCGGRCEDALDSRSPCQSCAERLAPPPAPEATVLPVCLDCSFASGGHVHVNSEDGSQAVRYPTPEEWNAALRRSESARREAEENPGRVWHEWRKRVERVFSVFAHEVMPIAEADDHRKDPEVVLPYLEAWFERLNEAENALASERAARESWEREFNVANAERIRLHNEAENFSERLGQFEAAGFPNVATVLDRVEAERAARERAERERDVLGENYSLEMKARHAAERERDEAIRLVNARMEKAERELYLQIDAAERRAEQSKAEASEASEARDLWEQMHGRLESSLSRAVEALRPFAEYGRIKLNTGQTPQTGTWHAVASREGEAELTAEHFAAARAVLAEIGGER